MWYCRAIRRRPISAWGLFIVLVAVLGAGVALLLTFSAPPVPHERQSPVPVRSPQPAGLYPEKPLALGAKAPDFVAAGFLNGQPPALGTPGIRLIVVDIWAHW
jgi:hypothetical protein